MMKKNNLKRIFAALSVTALLAQPIGMQVSVNRQTHSNRTPLRLSLRRIQKSRLRKILRLHLQPIKAPFTTVRLRL